MHNLSPRHRGPVRFVPLCVVLLAVSATLTVAADGDPRNVPFAKALRGRTMATDTGPALLKGTAALANETNAAVARVPPSIDFIPTGPIPPHGQGSWSTWGDLLLADNGKVYFGVGDHAGRDGHCSLWEYDPRLRRLRMVVDVHRLLGIGPDGFGEGKIHGRIDQGRDGWLYFATYWGLGQVPETLPAGWDGSHVIRFDPRTDRAEDLGAPFHGETWPMSALDPVRGNLFACGVQDYVMCYNVYERRLRYGGALPHGWAWFARSTFVDPRTGVFYGSNRSINAPDRRTGKVTAGIVRYDPKANRFAQTAARLPDNSRTGEKQDEWRAYTRDCDTDGAYYCCTDKGVLFKFFPEDERVEYVGVNWGKGYYCTSLALSPGHRYLYYTVDVHGGALDLGAPIIQYDLRTGARKVLAFLHPYYHRRYRYNMGGPFGAALSIDGAVLYMNWNGRFHQEAGSAHSFGDVCLLAVHIPEAERAE